ncbi:MAG: hemolysin III family protein [Clostridia bacterium]|nr:hemolysin III family protein [Clostridia bacterium]MDD4375613.1 hemolysin III family protein [Clostridia bacterium]
MEKIEKNQNNYLQIASKKLYTLGEEIFSSVVHGIGTALAISALVLLLVFTVKNGGDALDVVGISIYGFTLILLYTMSTLYHAITNDKAKKVFRIIDHCSIYLLIAGTFTPMIFSILRNNGSTPWIVFGVVWGIAIWGILMYAFFPGKFKILNLSSYIVMGWSAVFLIPGLMKELNTIGSKHSLIFLLAGGLAYTSGVVFYAIKKVKYFHSIWHIFVLAGSICHFFCILAYTLA